MFIKSYYFKVRMLLMIKNTEIESVKLNIKWKPGFGFLAGFFPF